MRPMATLQDLIEEAKVRTVWWGICVFVISYFLSHTSKSMWTNIPMSIIILAFFRYLSYEVEVRWRTRPVRRQTYLSHLAKKQLSVNDYRLSTMPPTSRWRRKIDSPSIEAAIENFIDKILQDFVVDLWYSSITPDKEAPALIRTLILDVLGEVSVRVKEINLVDLLTRDIVDLIGNQLDLYRKNQSEIGADVMGTLSLEERDERLKRHLIASHELHPALLSSESEYKVLQGIVGGILAVVMRPQEAQCPLVHCFSRELLTCLVLQPVMSFASPGYINELLEYIFLSNKDNNSGLGDSDKSSHAASVSHDHPVSKGDVRGPQPESKNTSSIQSSDLTLVKSSGESKLTSSEHADPKSTDASESHIQQRPADWAMVLEAATKRRTQVLAPENLDNMWTKGRNYQKKTAHLLKAEKSSGLVKSPGVGTITHMGTTEKDSSTNLNEKITYIDDKYMVNLMHVSHANTRSNAAIESWPDAPQDPVAGKSSEGVYFGSDSLRSASEVTKRSGSQIKRCSSTPDIGIAFMGKSGETIASHENSNSSKEKEEHSTAIVLHSEGSLSVPKVRCRVVGAYFEKTGSKSFAVYSIAVTDTDNKT